MTETPTQVPVVNYLVIADGAPHLVGHRCDHCGAVSLERRNACASCGSRSFSAQRLPDTGRIESFTILHRGAPKHIGPFISVLVRLDDGTYVKANLVGVAPEVESLDLDLPVRLVTYVAGTDEDGTEAVAFGYEYDTARAADGEEQP